jgi:hypothetical protein
VTSVKEEFITLYRSDPNVEHLVNEFVGAFVMTPSFAENAQVFCGALWEHFATYRVAKVSVLLPAQHQVRRRTNRSDSKRLTGVPAVRLRMLCVLLATRCLEFHGSQSLFGLHSFLTAYTEFVVSPGNADLIRFLNFMVGLIAFQPRKAGLGLSLTMCICLTYGSDKKFSDGSGVPGMERVSEFAHGTNDGDWVARLKFIYYRETGIKRQHKVKSTMCGNDRADSVATTTASASTSSVDEDGRMTSEDTSVATILVDSRSEPGVCSKRKTASWDVDSVSSLDDSVCAGKRRRGDSVSSGSTASVCEDAFLAFVGETDQLSGDFDVDDEESRVLSEFLADDDEETRLLSEFLAESDCGSLDGFDLDLDVFEGYPPHR